MKDYYLRKGTYSQPYKWKPDTTVVYNTKRLNQSVKTQTCSALANTNGEDFIVKYVYTSTFDKQGNEHRLAYVECGYVE